MVTSTQRVKYGGPSRVVVVAAPDTLLQRMAEVVRTTEGAELAASFGSPDDALDWLVWERQPWHLAYVDTTLPDGAGEALAARLHAAPRAGAVIGLCAHLWQETRARLAAVGVSDILEKGDLVAFRGHLEARVR